MRRKWGRTLAEMAAYYPVRHVAGPWYAIRSLPKTAKPDTPSKFLRKFKWRIVHRDDFPC